MKGDLPGRRQRSCRKWSCSSISSERAARRARPSAAWRAATACTAAPKLGPHRATIREWLVADLSAPRKQRHTARRIRERLVNERGATVAEPTVRTYVARVRREPESVSAQVTIAQVHPPGSSATTAQS